MLLAPLLLLSRILSILFFNRTQTDAFFEHFFKSGMFITFVMVISGDVHLSASLPSPGGAPPLPPPPPRQHCAVGHCRNPTCRSPVCRSPLPPPIFSSACLPRTTPPSPGPDSRCCCHAGWGSSYYTANVEKRV